MSAHKQALETYFKLMLSSGVTAIYEFVQKHELLVRYPLGKTFTLEEFCKDHQFKTVPTKVFLDTLVTVGLLEKKDNGFTISPVMELLKGNYKNLSKEYWDHLPTLLKSGEPFKRMDAVTDSEKEYQVQVKSLEWMMTPCAELMVDTMMGLTPKIKQGPVEVLDVGAGSGVWGFNFLYRNPQAKATLADWPAVLVVAKDTATKKNIIDRVSFIEGNFHQSEWPKEKFDVVTLGNVTHILTEEANKTLFKKIFDSMKPGGELIILDAYSEIPEGELARSLYQMGLTIRTIQGKVFMPDEMKPWLSSVGFKSFDFHSLNVIPRSMGMLIAKK